MRDMYVCMTENSNMVEMVLLGMPCCLTLYGLVASQFGDLKDVLENGRTVEDFITSYFGFRNDWLGFVAVVIVCIPLFFAFIYAFSIKAFNFQIR